jgi:tetratricopeptide (TPR) repeat protein
VLVGETPNEAIQIKNSFELYNQGVRLSKSGDYVEAIEKFEESIELNPDIAEAHHNLGAIYVELDRTEEAEIAFLNALDVAPDLSSSKEALAEMYSKQGDELVEAGLLDVAFNVLTKALSYDQDHAHVNYLLGVLYVKRDEEEKAIQHFKEYLRFATDSKYTDEAREALERLQASE